MFGNDADTGRWRRLNELLDEALELSPDDREAWLATLSGTDGALSDELRALLDVAGNEAYPRFLSDAISASPAASAMVGRRVGAYVIESEIGSGGMGSVWRATRADGQFEGYVAIKFVHAAWLGRIGEQRFRREGRLLARLNHPHIARLLDAGVIDDGQPYLVLEYVAGEAIDAYCEARGLDVSGHVLLFLDVLDAVAHAHRHLIVHRDVKPSNVLVTDAGDVKLLDFGIAKPLARDGEGDATRSGLALTPDYAAPEQLGGESATTATDVYALGLLLYRLLAGVLPQRPKRSDEEWPRASVAAATPERARALRGDLDNILAKAIRQRPGERYATVDAFADDLKRFLRDEPVQARRDTLSYRAAKFVRRHRGSVALGAMALVALIGATVVTATQLVEAREQRDRAQVQLKRAQAFDDLMAIVLSTKDTGQGLKPRELLDRGYQLARTEFAADPAVRAELLFSLATLYLQAGETARERALEAEAHELAQRAGDMQLIARTGCSIARGAAQVGQFKDATASVERYLAELPAGEEYDATRSHCLLSASMIAMSSMDGDAALRYAQAGAYLQDQRASTEWARLRMLITLAGAQNNAGRLAEASATYESVNEGFERIQVTDTGFAKTLQNNWAIVLFNLGQPRRGVALAERALEHQKNAVSADAYSRVVYAANLIALERFAEARAVLESALSGARANNNTSSAQMVTHWLAHVFRETGQLDAAARMIDESTAMLATLQVGPDHEVVGVLQLSRAQLAQARGDLPTALEHAEAALAVFSGKAGARRRVANVHLVRAEIYLDMKQVPVAREEAVRALRMYEEVLGRGVTSYYLGRSWLALARSQAAGGEHEAARRSAGEAWRHLGPAVGEEHSLTRAAAGIAGGAGDAVKPAGSVAGRP